MSTIPTPPGFHFLQGWANPTFSLLIPIPSTDFFVMDDVEYRSDKPVRFFSVIYKLNIRLAHFLTLENMKRRMMHTSLLSCTVHKLPTQYRISHYKLESAPIRTTSIRSANPYFLYFVLSFFVSRQEFQVNISWIKSSCIQLDPNTFGLIQSIRFINSICFHSTSHLARLLSCMGNSNTNVHTVETQFRKHHHICHTFGSTSLK